MLGTVAWQGGGGGGGVVEGGIQNFWGKWYRKQNKTAKIILNQPIYSSNSLAQASLGLKTLKVNTIRSLSLFVFLNAFIVYISDWLAGLEFITTVHVLVQNL